MRQDCDLESPKCWQRHLSGDNAWGGNEVYFTALIRDMMEFDNDLAPIVGQQITLNANASNAVINRIELLRQRALTPFVSKLLGGNVTECDLIAHGVIDGDIRGYLLDTKTQGYRSDSAQEPMLSHEVLIARALEQNNSLTFTCTVPGKGWQAALDRDLDGLLNADEKGR